MTTQHPLSSFYSSGPPARQPPRVRKPHTSGGPKPPLQRSGHRAAVKTEHKHQSEVNKTRTPKTGEKEVPEAEIINGLPLFAAPESIAHTEICRLLEMQSKLSQRVREIIQSVVASGGLPTYLMLVEHRHNLVWVRLRAHPISEGRGLLFVPSNDRCRLPLFGITKWQSNRVTTIEICLHIPSAFVQLGMTEFFLYQPQVQVQSLYRYTGVISDDGEAGMSYSSSRGVQLAQTPESYIQSISFNTLSTGSPAEWPEKLLFHIPQRHQTVVNDLLEQKEAIRQLEAQVNEQFMACVLLPNSGATDIGDTTTTTSMVQTELIDGTSKPAIEHEDDDLIPYIEDPSRTTTALSNCVIS